MDENLEFTSEKRNAKQGRRARKAAQEAAAAAASQSNGDIGGDESAEDLVGHPPPSENQGASQDGPVRPPRRQMGWGDDAPKPARSRDRVEQESRSKAHDSDDDMPVIPDLDDVQEEDMATQIAAPPSVPVNRVITYRELDNDLLKHSQLLTLDNEIDLKLLSKALSAESEVMEEDKPWDWDHLFTEVSSELQTEWDQTISTQKSDTSIVSKS
ncbi:intraflagellar transport protein 43 homolog A isoform X2 [Strongylocentrotus purpuratus]|uniref:Intraflagellar transport protein 43 homolog n=1 Tax=Strongylocentrotus purpuratus TaxID=7668 RepID=A0A7M7PP93_STRPU|nr:intraflagellar transport protein 43 homolog A isoform X2 [Strongylocentrotus purpuratus]